MHDPKSTAKKMKTSLAPIESGYNDGGLPQSHHQRGERIMAQGVLPFHYEQEHPKLRVRP